ncbi:unnamed protein product [Symbiodinium sp. CCMP2592]|nr:unnamed protein product [Symbiodinium sp. CCMP2592]
MPPQSETKYLHQLTEVPAGWDLATVIGAFAHLAVYQGDASANRAREVVSLRLLELWAEQPAEAEAWLERFGELNMATRQGRLCEALLRHGAAEWGKYEDDLWRFSEAGLLRGELRPAAEREDWAALYRQQPHTRDRCRELAEQLVEAESPETARKRQKLEEETAQRHRLEAELQKSQEEECRDLRNRLATAEAEVSSKEAELQAAQNESAKCKEQCAEFATRAAAAEGAAAEMRTELRQLQEENGQCQERCEKLLARLEAEASQHAETKERLSQADSDAAGKEVELQRLQEESRGLQERCQLAEARAASAGSQAELQLEKAVLQQHLAKAEAERSGMLGQLLHLHEEKGMHKERIRELERQLCKAKQRKAHHAGALTHHGVAFSEVASSSQEPDLAERLGYSIVDDDGTSSSVLSCSSWFSVKPDSVKDHCFMVDAIFKTRSYGADFFLMGRDLKKGSQVVAADDATILEVAKSPEICDAGEVVEMQAGTATLRVTPDHLVQVADVKGEVEESLYLEAGKLKVGDLVMLDSGDPAALTSVTVRPLACQVLKIVFEPYLPVAVFSRPSCILSLGHKKAVIRRGGRGQGGPGPLDGSMDGRASIPITAGDYMD